MSARAQYLAGLANRIMDGESICSSSSSDGDDSDYSDDKLSMKLGPVDCRLTATATLSEGRRSRLSSLPRTNNDKIRQVVNHTALTIFKADVTVAEKSVALARPKPLIMTTNPQANNRHYRYSNASSRTPVSPARSGSPLIVTTTRRMTSSPSSIRRRAENIHRRNTPEENKAVIEAETNVPSDDGTPRRKGANSHLVRSKSYHDAQQRRSVGARTDSFFQTSTRVDGMSVGVSASLAGSMVPVSRSAAASGTIYGSKQEMDAKERSLPGLRQRRDRMTLEVITDYPGANARSGIKGSQLEVLKQRTYLTDNASIGNKAKCNEGVENNAYYTQEDTSTLVAEATTIQSFSSSLSNDSQTTKRTSNSRALLRVKRLSASGLMNHTRDTASGAAKNDTSMVADNNVTRPHSIPYSRSKGAQTSKRSSTSVDLDRLKRLSIGCVKPNGDTSGGAKSESVKSKGTTNKGSETRRNTRDTLGRLKRLSMGGLEPKNDTAGTLKSKSERSHTAAITGSETRRNTRGELDRLKRLSIGGLKSESDTAGKGPKYESARSHVTVNKDNEIRRSMSSTGGGTKATNSRGDNNGLTRKAYLESLSKMKLSLANGDDASASSTVSTNATSLPSISHARIIDSEPSFPHNNSHYSRRKVFGSSTGGGTKAPSSIGANSGLTRKAYLESLTKKKMSLANDYDASSSSTIDTNATSLPSISHARIIDSDPSFSPNNSYCSKRHGFGTSLPNGESSCHEQKRTLINDCNPNMISHLSCITSVVREGYEVSIFPNKSGEISEHSEDLPFDRPAELDRSGIEEKKECEKNSLGIYHEEKRNDFVDGPIRSVNVEKGAPVSRSASSGRIENIVGDSRQASTDRRFVDTVVMEKVADKAAKVNISKSITERCDRSKIRVVEKDATIHTQNVSTGNHKPIAEKGDIVHSIRVGGMEKKGREAPDKSRATRKIGNIVVEDCGNKSFLSLSPVSRRAAIRGRAKSRFGPSTTSSDIVGARSATCTSGIAPSCQVERKSSGVDQILPSTSVGNNAAVAAIKSKKSETEDMKMSTSSKASSMRALYRPLSLPISRVSATGVNSTSTSEEGACGVLPRARWKTVRSAISEASPLDEKAKKFTSTPTSPPLAQFQRKKDRLRNVAPPPSAANAGDRKEAILAARTPESRGKRCVVGVESRVKETMEPANNDNESCGIAVMLSRARQRRSWSGKRIQAPPKRPYLSSKRVDAQSSSPTRPITSPAPPSKRSIPLPKRVVDQSSSSTKFSGLSLEIPPRMGASKSSKKPTFPSQTIPPRNKALKQRFTGVKHSSEPGPFLETPPRNDVVLVKVNAAPRAMVATNEANDTNTVVSLLKKNSPKHRRSISLPPSPTSKDWKALVARSRVDFDVLKPSRLVSFSISVLCKAVLPVQRLARQYLSKVAVIKRKRNIVLVQSLFRRWVSMRYFKSAQVIAFRCQCAYQGRIVRDEIMFQHYCAARIQSALRGYFCHAAFMGVVGTTILLQSIWRMHRLRKIHITCKRRTRMEMKVTLTQSIVRRWIAMKSYMQKKKTYGCADNSEELSQAQNHDRLHLHVVEDVVTCQTVVRRFFALQYATTLRSARDEDSKAALVIQTNFRRHMAMLDFSYLVSDIVLCQAAARRFLALRKIVKQMSARDEDSKAALVIQTNFRRHMAMLDFSYLVSDIVLCQAAVRKFLALRKIAKLRHARDGWSSPSPGI